MIFAKAVKDDTAQRNSPASAGLFASAALGIWGARIGATLQAGLSALLLIWAHDSASTPVDVKRGEYLAKAGGCVGCHTEEKSGAVPFAGGRAIKSPFGTFYGPNITPHSQAGIGRWTEADFVRALRHGKRPDGANYYPAFPYPSFTLISDGDLRDLWAYLRSLPPSNRANREHELPFLFRWRFLVSAWKWLFFTSGPFVPDARLSQLANRGAYLVKALGHCSECHTPRNFLGGPKRDRLLAGGKTPDNKRVPNLTPTRLKKWSDEGLKEFLLTGLTPDGDAASEAMDEVIRNTTSQLTADDLAALIAYLRTLAPLADEPRGD
jgi:mono/diheme cytochrome c family protein